MANTEKLFVYLDGSSQGNPGEAALGVSINDGDGNVIEEIAKPIGRATNNIAEYKALIEACRSTLEYSPKEAVFLTDSQLVANQINGTYETREPHLKRLRQTAMELLSQFNSWKVSHVERRVVHSAHRLADKAARSQSKLKENEETSRKEEMDKAKKILRELDKNELKRALAFLSGLRDSQSSQNP